MAMAMGMAYERYVFFCVVFYETQIPAYGSSHASVLYYVNLFLATKNIHDSIK